jgi:hypothetical protein
MKHAGLINGRLSGQVSQLYLVPLQQYLNLLIRDCALIIENRDSPLTGVTVGALVENYGLFERPVKSKIVSLAIFAMTIPQVSAQAPETSILYNLCIKNDPFCGAYLLGTASVLSVIGKAYEDDAFEPTFIAPLGTFAICSRGGPINAQVLRNIFVAWVETDPKRKTEPMNESALNAIQAAWPCRPRSN